jgi:hypothetical protein
MRTPVDPSEIAKHQRLIELLADETHHAVEEVEPVYDTVLSRLKATAEIADFVPVFAWRRTRAVLLQGDRDSTGVRKAGHVSHSADVR